MLSPKSSPWSSVALVHVELVSPVFVVPASAKQFSLSFERVTTMPVCLTTGLLIIRGKKSQISRDFGGQNRGKIGRFRGNFQGKLGRKAIGKQTADFVVIFRANFARNRSVLR